MISIQPSSLKSSVQRERKQELVSHQGLFGCHPKNLCKIKTIKVTWKLRTVLRPGMLAIVIEDVRRVSFSYTYWMSDV